MAPAAAPDDAAAVGLRLGHGVGEGVRVGGIDGDSMWNISRSAAELRR